MDASLAWLTLEVKDRDTVAAFYREHLDLPVVRESDTDTVLAAGPAELRLRRPTAVPRGGLHTHYAVTVPAAEYDDWYDRLAAEFDLTEATFGRARSLYLYDPAGNCVELGETETEGPGVDGVFEVVLEVSDLDTAVEFYTDLGFAVVDDGGDRRRSRLSAGDIDLELWEPQLGIADGRGGVHVDWGLRVDDPEAALKRIAAWDRPTERVDAGIRLRDPDGHYLTLSP